MVTAKEQVLRMLRTLPDDCTFEDIQYHLYVLDKIERGRRSAETAPTHAHAEVETRLRKYLAETPGEAPALPSLNDPAN